MGSDVTTGRQFTLAQAEQRVVVGETGATLLTWDAGGRRLLDAGPVVGAVDRAYRGKVLMPWPNRVRDGRYEFGGAEHRLPVDEPDRGHALHGLALWSDWTAVDVQERAVTLELQLRPRPGYPFALRLRAGYALGADGLAVTLEALNVGDGPAPFGAGL